MLKEGEWPLSMSGYRTKRRGGAVISSATVGLLAVGGRWGAVGVKGQKELVEG